MSIDLSGYKGLRVLRATAVMNGKSTWCVIVVNVDDSDCPNLVALEPGQITWANDRGECNRDGVEITSILGELVLPCSSEPPCCPPPEPSSCIISTDCSSDVTKQLVDAMTSQFAMVVGLVDKLTVLESRLVSCHSKESSDV